MDITVADRGLLPPVRFLINAPPRQASNGLSLIELLIALAIISIAGGVVIPAFGSVIAENRLATQVNDFVSSLHLGKSEAVRRGARVIMCQSDNSQDCAALGGWQYGWLMFADSNHNRRRDRDEAIIMVYQGTEGPVSITSGRRRRIVFQAVGTTPGSNATYTFCHTSYPGKVRAVILSNTGRPRLSRKGPANRDLICP